MPAPNEEGSSEARPLREEKAILKIGPGYGVRKLRQI